MNYLGEYQIGSPWTGTVDPAGEPIPYGTTWAPSAGATVDVSVSDGARKTQKLMAGSAGWNFMWTILIAVGAVALGGAAFWAYREYGHKLFGGRKGGGGRRPRRRGRSKRR